jgi:glutamine synthetase
MNKSELLKLAKDEDIQFISVRFSDLPGVEQQFTMPTELLEDSFEDGLAFDGSSLKGFQSIDKSDLKLLPVPETAYIDPFREHKTLNVTFNIVNPDDDTPYEKATRGVAEATEKYLNESGIADTAYVAPEAEFYVFDSVQYETKENGTFYRVDSEEGAWNTGKYEEGQNLAHKPGYKGGYFPVSPTDHTSDLRDEMTSVLQDVGLSLERSHHEVGTGGQQEINYRFNTLTKAGDDLLKFKYVIKNVADAWGKTATFMPKPIFKDNGSGMHTHQSLWKDGTNLFFDKDGYSGLSQTALWYIGGLLKHAPAVLAFTNPSVNSYRRLVPGYEAPTNLVYSGRNRSAAIRIPMGNLSPNAKRLEFRVPDPTANPYLAFSAQVLAGLDGIKNKIDPGEPADYNVWTDAKADIKTVPASLDAALEELQKDQGFLLDSGAFTQDLIDSWIELKSSEVDALRLRPHPYEFDLYYSC